MKLRAQAYQAGYSFPNASIKPLSLNPIIDEILQPKPVDTRIAQFHQTLNIAQALNGRKRFALDAVDHVEIALLSRRGVVELEPLHDRTNHRTFVARRQAKGDSFEQSFYPALGGLALLPQQAVLGDQALRRKRDVRLRKLGQKDRTEFVELFLKLFPRKIRRCHDTAINH